MTRIKTLLTEYHTPGGLYHYGASKLADPDQILSLLAEVSLRGKGLTTENLMEYVMDEGFFEPIYLNVKGEESRCVL